MLEASKASRMSISEDFLRREDLRSHLFRETWSTLIPEVFRDVPTYYDKGNAVASLGSCSRWSAKFARAIHKHLQPGAKVLDVCSGTHDIPLRLLALDPTLDIHAVDGSIHMTAEGQRRAPVGSRSRHGVDDGPEDSHGQQDVTDAHDVAHDGQGDGDHVAEQASAGDEVGQRVAQQEMVE